MSVGERTPSLSRRILAGDDPRLRRLAAEGLVPLAPEELVPVLVALAGDEESEIAERARRSLDEIEPQIARTVVRETEDEEVLRWFAGSDRPLVAEAVIRRRDAPLSLLREMASRVEPDLQEVLILRQDAIVEDPGILDALEANPELSRHVRGRIGEYRQHLVRPAEEPEEPEERAAEAETAEPDEEEVVEAIDEARRRPRQEGEEIERITGLSESQIRSLPVPVRLKLTRGASRSLRGVLLRDPNPMVAVSVLENSAVGESEAEQIAASRSVVREVLETISRHRQWMRKPAVRLALVRNPRTPVGIAVRLCSGLSVRELRQLRRDHNVADAVRSTARRLYTLKSR